MSHSLKTYFLTEVVFHLAFDFEKMNTSTEQAGVITRGQKKRSQDSSGAVIRTQEELTSPRLPHQKEKQIPVSSDHQVYF